MDAAIFLIIVFLIIFSCVFHFIDETITILGIGGSKNKNVDTRYYWDLESQIKKQCFDDRTNIFNWGIWLES